MGLVKALESLQAIGAGWPINIRVLVEGEEECGGAGIATYLEQYADEVPCDAVLIADTSMPAPQTPALVYGVRGILYVDICARGARRDLHSGEFGGIAPNPLLALAEILSRLKSFDGPITIPELYQRLERPAKEERQLWHGSAIDIPELSSRYEIDTLPGERDIDAYERLWSRPPLRFMVSEVASSVKERKRSFQQRPRRRPVCACRQSCVWRRRSF